MSAKFSGEGGGGGGGGYDHLAGRLQLSGKVICQVMASYLSKSSKHK